MVTVASAEFLARSTTLTGVGWIGYDQRAIAGWIAGTIMKTHYGLLTDNLVVVVGALIRGFLLSFAFDTAKGGWWFTLFTAILGAVILLGLLRVVPEDAPLGGYRCPPGLCACRSVEWTAILPSQTI